jgi:hypothetical protein
MPRATKEEEYKYQYHPVMRMKALGVALFVAGLLRYIGLDWSVVLMVLGVLVLLKALILQQKKFKK